MRIVAILGVVVFGLASIALAIVGVYLTLAGAWCPGCTHPSQATHNHLCFLGAGLCAVAAVGCGFAMRRSSRPAVAVDRPKTNKLGLR
jgi:hypothetical protein